MREVDSIILYAVQDSWMLLLIWSYHVLNYHQENTEVGFEDYFLNKSTSAQIRSSEWWEIRFTSVKSRECPQSPSVLCLFLFLFYVS